MAYDYYRSSVPGWGTSQFQFSTPPAPAFRPQPSWGGFDYYNAHALNPDPTFYNSIMSRSGQVGPLNLGRREARYWHRRVYSGMSPLTQLLPTDIGAAAAYEAYRTWKYNPSLYEPLGMDSVRLREGLVGMAIAETTRLWQYSGRPMDTYGLRAASEAAASVANVLAERLLAYTAGEADVIPPPAGVGYGARARSNSFNVPNVMRAGGSPYLGGGAALGGGIPAGPPSVTPLGPGVGAAGGMGLATGASTPLPASPMPGVAATGGTMGMPPTLPPSPIPGAMAGGAAAVPPGPMPTRVPVGTGVGTGLGVGGVGTGVPPVPPVAASMAPATMGGAMGTGIPPAGGADGRRCPTGLDHHNRTLKSSTARPKILGFVL
ncbi:hypothetical protein ONZ51_g13441 [Trametes cubensis]|uniref:Uncharacterized protein n=1 Tax=Trametes cubensis TaxID=1111947 RepID=A0AAD7X4J6_9APHY|nr:hypothetical protein ONZ51_g13441 [Trametes cubensis]